MAFHSEFWVVVGTGAPLLIVGTTVGFVPSIAELNRRVDEDNSILLDSLPRSIARTFLVGPGLAYVLGVIVVVISTGLFGSALFALKAEDAPFSEDLAIWLMAVTVGLLALQFVVLAFAAVSRYSKHVREDDE